MITPLAYAVMVLAGVSLVWGLLTTALGRPPGKAQLLFAGVVELVVVTQSGIALVALVIGFRPAELATTIGYLIGIALLIPVAWVWANSERTRYSGTVLAVAAASVAAMTLRLLVLWVAA